jgi:hypothetical protein
LLHNKEKLMTTRLHIPRTLAVLALAASAAAPALAGRPLAVDDAGTNATGEGHVEAWVARSDGATVINLSPAYAFADGLEVSATLSRDTTNKINGSGIGLKWLITPSKDSGCNFGASFGAARASGGGDSVNGGSITGLLSCNGTGLGNVHVNLGSVKVSGVSAATTWGIALEHEFGAVTPHIEWFGVEGSKPAVQIGARTDIAKNIQLDGTVGRADGTTLYSLGMKFKF